MSTTIRPSTQADPNTGDAANLIGKEIESNRHEGTPRGDGKPPQQAKRGAPAQSKTGAKSDDVQATQFGVAIGPDGKPVIGKDGKPLLVALDKDGKPLQPDANLSGRGLRFTTLIAEPVKDTMDTRASLTALAALSQTVQSNDAAPKGDLSVVLGHFQSLEPLLGAPNGQPMGEAFVFERVTQLAEIPAASPELVQLVETLRTDDPERAPTERPVTPQRSTVAAPASLRLASIPEEHDEPAKSGSPQQQKPQQGETKLTPHEQLARVVEKQFYKFGDATPQTLIGHFPPAIQKTLEQQIPVIAKSLRQRVDPKKSNDSDIIVLSQAEIEAERTEVEKAFGPLFDTRMKLIERVAAADPVALRQAVTAVQTGQRQSSNEYTLALDLVPRFGSVDRAISSLDFANGDVMALLSVVMLQCAKTNADILRDIMKELQQANQEKAAQREKVTALKQGRAKSEAMARDEFAAGRRNGTIDPSWTMEDYMSVRKVAWGDGVSKNGRWIGPPPELPPLSDEMRLQFAGPKVKVADAAGGELTDARLYGLSEDTMVALKKMYDTEPLKSQRGDMVFSTWLTDVVGLIEVKTPDQVITNMTAVENIITTAKNTPKPQAVQAAAPVQGAVPFSEMKWRALELAYARSVIPPCNANANAQYIKALEDFLSENKDKMSEADTASFNRYLDVELRQDLYNLGTDVQGMHDYIVGRIRSDWEGDEDRDVHHMMIADGQVWVHIYDDVGGSDEVNGYRTWDRLLSLDQDVRNRDLRFIAGDKDFGPTVGKVMLWGKGQKLESGQLAEMWGNLQNGRGLEHFDSFRPTPKQVEEKTEIVGLTDADYERLTKTAGTDKQKIQAIIDAKGSKNALGEYFEAPPPGCDGNTFRRLLACGVIKMGKSDAQLAEEKAASEEQIRKFAEFGAAAQEAGLNHEGSFEELGAYIEGEEGKLDSMGDMTQLMQMRLQKYLDAYSKMFEMLSNAMKKIGQTQESMAGNLK